MDLQELAAHPANAWRLKLVDKRTVARYVRMQTEPPAIVVDGSGMILDGLHRVAAAILKGCTEIKEKQNGKTS
jgi:hypothetical protein